MHTVIQGPSHGKVIAHRLNVNTKRKGPRTKAPFTSHHPLPPKRSFRMI
jgi:hypothetical protein